MKVKTKKVMAMLCLILILLTTLPIQALATFITDINSDAVFGVISGSLSEYNHELHYATYDGSTYMLFCVQRGITSPNGSTYSYNSSFIAQYKADRPAYEKIAEMIYFGYTMNYGTGLPSSTAAKQAACATQQYVWEYIHNYIDSSLDAPSRDSWNSTYMSSSIYSSWLSKTQSYYNQYHSSVSFDNTTASVVIGGSTTITDSNGVLANFASFSQNINGVTFSHTQGSNDLTISVDSSNNTDTVTFNSTDYNLYELLPNGSSYNSSTMSNYVYFKFSSGSVQNLMFSNYIDPVSFKISVEVESGNVLIVKTNINSDVVANCGFELYSDSSCKNLVGTGTSNSSGELKFERLATGTYYVKEVSVPTGYLLDTTVQKVTVKNKETAEVTFKNNEPTGEISIEKTDSETGNDDRIDGTSHHGDATLAGTTYTLYASSDIYNVAKTIKYFSANEKIAEYVFDEYGNATINIVNTTTSANLTTSGNTLKGLPVGSYYSKETTISKGYTQDTTTHNYTLSYKDMYTSTITTSETVSNKVQKAKFEVIKVSTNTNSTADVIEGAEFTAILSKYVDYYGSFDEALNHLDEFAEDEYSILTTDSTGHGVSGLLAYGEYTVYETYTPNDEILTVEPFYILIDEDSDGVIKEFIENDLPFESYLKMVKVDADTGKTVTLSNATFTLKKLNEDTNEWEEVSCKVGNTYYKTWTTDDEGTAYTETKLSAGTYKIEELVIPNGFLELEEELTFRVALSNKTLEFDEDWDAWITVTVENSQPTGTLIIDKNIALRDDVDTSLLDISDLSEIEFKLTAKENIIDYADGSVIYEAGEEIITFNLDKNGDYTLEDLPMGSYELQETKTLDGLALDTTVYDVVFTQEDTTTKIYTETKEISNDTIVVEFSKTDITGDEELTGATLTVTDQDGNVIDTWVSGETTHKIEGLVAGETYVLKEEIQVEGYVKASDIEFVIEDTNEIQKVTMIDKIVTMTKEDIGGNEIEGATIQVLDEDGNIVDEWVSEKEPHKIKNLVENQTYTLHEEICVNEYVKATDVEFTVTEDKETQELVLIDKVVEIVKTDLVTGEEIEGAELEVIDKETGETVDKWTSTTEPHKVSGLEENKTYILKEVTCPYGYEQAEKIEFTVTEDKETQKIEMQDMPILTNIRVIKIDSETKETIKEDFVFGIYTDENCTELIQQIDSTDGYVDFNELRYGTYYIREITSPSGYELSDRIVKLEINDIGVFIDDEQIEANEDGIYSFEFENTKIVETPNTSDDRNITLVKIILVIAVVGLISFGIYEINKKRKNK